MQKPDSHYFIADETLEDHFTEFSYYYGAHSFTFVSNAGLFSPGHVDPASSLLIQTLPPLRGSLLDLGCGYGPIGIVLARANGLQLTMADVNPRALDCARENCRKNGVEAELLCSDCFQSISGSFDHIALNPPIHAGKAVIFEMYRQAPAHLNPGGRLYVVIQEKHGAKSTQKELTEIFGSCTVLYKKKGYYLFSCEKPSTSSIS